MYFEHPELLYALFLLIIPLIVHLFRLRRFQKEDFTNVKFLKKIIQETRKSSRLKKFLLLITRLLLITCLVLAFAQPFIPATNKALRPSKTLVYLDNSFSMQASENQGTLLQNSINQLLESLQEKKEYALFTNHTEYFNRSVPDLKKALQEIAYTSKQINAREIQLKAENYFKKYPGFEKNLVIISDFQHFDISEYTADKESFNSFFIDQKPEQLINISIDTAYIESSNPENLSLEVIIKNFKNTSNPVSISIFNDNELLGRRTVQEFKDSLAKINFRLENKEITKGRIEIEDSGLRYDNFLFFNVNTPLPVKTVIISEAENEFLQRIYTEPEFETSVFSSGQIDFNKLNAANLIVLNEVEQISASFLNNLRNLQADGTSFLIIPSENALNDSQSLNRLGFPAFNQKVETERLVTTIVYDHPLFEGVFEDRTENFEYPKIRSSYELPSSSAILKYQDGQAFLMGNGSNYLFTAPLNSANSNFSNSPLIVPVLYQIGLNALKKNELYYLAEKDNKIDIPLELGQDKVLHLAKPGLDFIPQQQNFSNRVEVTTSNIALEAGNYEVLNNSAPISSLSFNHERKESEPNYTDISAISDFKIYDSIEEYFSMSNAALQITALWKWFIIFALIFLAIEMLLIKFLK